LNSPADTPPPSERRAFIDWARGIAVLLMIEAHTIDAWTREADRTTAGYRDAIILGGFAAPLFLWLAGLSLVLSMEKTARREKSRAPAIEIGCRRGLQIFVLAFLFRLQAFVLTPGSHAVMLFRVDILNIMGPALAAAALIWGLSRSPAGAMIANATAACAVAMLAPIVRTLPAVDRLPIWIQWYVRPAGEYTAFTTFPWAGFVFAGAAVGVALARTRAGTRTWLAMLALAGGTATALGFYTASLPSIYSQASFWTSSPTYFAVRLGVLMLLFAALGAVDGPEAGRLLAPIARLGRRSLLVYWIHVELVYGYATWPFHHRLPFALAVIAYVTFAALMYALVLFIERPSVQTLRQRVWATT
jgi:uncharacterized membrane protein